MTINLSFFLWEGLQNKNTNDIINLYKEEYEGEKNEIK